MRTLARYTLSCLVLLALAGFSGGPVLAATGESLSGPRAGVPVDLIFIDMMIPHHESAIAMAHVALMQGEHQQVRSLARAIIATQQAEIARLKTWRDQWYPGAPPVPQDQIAVMMHGASSATPDKLSDGRSMTADPVAELHALTTTEGPFDRVFLELMVSHHRGAVQMARMTLPSADHPEVKRLAQTMIDLQGREITEMSVWLATWYGVGTLA